MLGTAVAGATSVSGLVAQIRAKVASVSDPSTDVAATQAEVDQMVQQIGATVQSSAFNGVNLLNGSNTAANGLTFVAATANDYTAAARPRPQSAPERRSTSPPRAPAPMSPWRHCTIWLTAARTAAVWRP